MHESYTDTKEHPQSHLQGGCAHLQSHAGLKVVGWWLDLLCFKQEKSWAWSFSDSFQRCLLGANHLLGSRAGAMEMLPQPPRVFDLWGEGPRMKLVLKYPREIVSTESWKGHPQCGLCKISTVRHRTMLHRFSHIFLHTDYNSCCSSSTDLLFHFILRLVFSSLSKDNSLILVDVSSYQKKSCWLSFYLVSKRYRISPIAFHSEREGNLDKKELG